jgi:hypothetical protein
MATGQVSHTGDPGTVAFAKQVFRLLRQSNYQGIYRRVPITPGLVQDLAALSVHIERVGAMADAVAKEGEMEWDELLAPGTDPPGILEEAYCQLAGRHLGGPVFFDEGLVAEVYDAIAEVHYRSFLEHLLRSTPLSAMDHHNRGTARCETGDHEGAVDDHTLAIGMDPAEPRYYLSRARCMLEHLHDPLSAALDIRMAEELADPAGDPSVLDLPVLKARILLAQGRTVGVVRALMEFVSDAGSFVASAAWEPGGFGTAQSGVRVHARAVLENVEEAIEVLEALPSEEDVRMIDRLLRNLAAKL